MLTGRNSGRNIARGFCVGARGCKRTLNQRHFDAQMIGGIVLHQGKIAEMKTGEGKTLSATLPAYLNALKARRAHCDGKRLFGKKRYGLDGADLRMLWV